MENNTKEIFGYKNITRTATIISLSKLLKYLLKDF